MDGHNALEEVPEILRRLAALEHQRNRDAPPIMDSWPIAYPISVGRIQGGDWPSTVTSTNRARSVWKGGTVSRWVNP